MKRRTKFLGLISIIALGLLLLAATVGRAPDATSAAQGATVRLQPGSQNVQLGDTFTVDVSVENATNLAAFEFRITYDPTVLKLEGVTTTDFLASTGRHAICPPIDSEQNTTDAWFGCATTSSPGGPAPVSGSSVLAQMKFTAKGPGLTYLTFVKYQLVDEMNNDCCEPVSLSEAAVRVVAPDQPTPDSPPATPTFNPSALTPTPRGVAPTPSTYLTPGPGETPMSQLVDRLHLSGTTGSSDSSGSGSTAGNSPRAGEGPSEKDPAWWPPLAAGLLAAAGASLLPIGLRLRKVSSKRRI